MNSIIKTPILSPLAAALLMALGIEPSLATVSFDAPPVFPATGPSPSSLYSYDLNADGAWDLVWVSSDDNTVLVALNNGAGQFPNRSVYATGVHPVALQVTNIDARDGYDLAVVNHDDDSVSVFLNNGDGTFKAKVDTPTGHHPVSISSDSVNFTSGNLDLNLDGKLDLVVANEGDNTFSLLLGNGDGTFTPKLPAVPTGGKPGAIMVAPLFINNTDYYDDVAVLLPDDNRLAYFETKTNPDGTGTGTFKDPISFPTGAHPSSLMWGFNKSAGNNVGVFVSNEGDNSFSVFNPYAETVGFKPKEDYAVGSAPVGIPQVDWNGLGYPINLNLVKEGVWSSGIDMVTVNRAGNSLSVALNALKGGTYAPRTDYPTGNQPNSVGMGDFNIDGIPDLIVLNGADNNFTALKGYGNGTLYKSAAHLSATGAGPSAVAKGDFNGDNLVDLAVVNTTANSVSILLGNGDDSFQSAVTMATGQAPSAVAAGDVNADGALDLTVTLSATNSIAVLLGDGHGAFAESGLHPSTAMNPNAIVLQDVNKDNQLDLIVANSGANTVSVLRGNGNGSFQAKTDVAVGVTPMALAVMDFNGDSNNDVAVANNAANTVSVLLGNGSGGFTKTAADSATGASPQALVATDFNADGKADIAVSNMTDNTVSVLLGKGDGTFQAKADFATGNGPKGLDTLDVNFDHKPDLVVANSTANTVSVLENKGDGSLLGKVDYTVGQVPVAVQIGKIDADIKPDLVVVNQGDNTVQIVPNSALAGVRLVPARHLSLGTVGVSGTGTNDISLTNNGKADLVISSVAITPASAFSQTNNCTALLKVGDACRFHVQFTPMQQQAYDAVFSFVGSDSITAHQVALHGEGTTSNADLGLTMTASPSHASVNGLIKYSLEISNYGQNKANTITVTDTLPTGGVWFRTDGVPCTQTGNQVQCSVGDIEVGAKATVDIWVTPTVAGKLANSATVSSALPDPNPHDNVASRIVAIAALNLKSQDYIDLSLALKGGKTGAVGQAVSYQATVMNKGLNAAGNVTVSLPVPAGASFNSAGSDVACSAANSTVVCQTSSLAKSASKSFAVAFSYSAAKTYILSAKVFAMEGDKSIKNNAAQVKTSVR